VLDALSCKEEYQRKMPWENIQILRIMFVGKNNLERKIQEAYAEDHLMQGYFKNLHEKKKVKRITLLDELLR
jgi:hypothetical protein